MAFSFTFCLKSVCMFVPYNNNYASITNTKAPLLPSPLKSEHISLNQEHLWARNDTN